MSPFSRSKRHHKAPSTSAAASGLALQQSQSLYPWSAHALPFGQSPSPFLRNTHALSTNATAAGELFLFGGYEHSSRSAINDLYVFSTRYFTAALLETSGDIPGPRYGHTAVLTSTTLLIWGGTTDLSLQNAQTYSDDDSFYLLNLVSREWTRIVVNGPGPGGRYYHTMSLVGSKLFVFGGRTPERRLNDIWTLDLNCLKSNPFWESYEPAPGDEKPLPRAAHVSVTIGDRIIIFGGSGDSHIFNDTWSFNISTRKWTELQCTGSIPSPRTSHAAVLVNDVMYVFGGCTDDGTYLGDLTALNLSNQRWTVFQDIGPGPSGMSRHAMACDGTRVFVLGGARSPGVQADDTKLIHVIDTKLLDYPEPDSDVVNPSEKTTLLVRESPASPPTRGQPHRPSYSSPYAHAAHGAFPFQGTTPEELGPTSQQVTREQNLSLNGLPLRPMGASGRPRRVPEEGDGGEGSTEHHANLVGPDAPSGQENARLEDGRLIELERQLSEMRGAKTKRDRRIAQLTDELERKSALLERAEANAAEANRRAGLEQRELQTRLDESLLSRDRAHEQAQSATFRAAEANERSQRELAEVHAKLRARESEFAAVRLRLTDAEVGWAKSRAEADALRAAQTAAGPVNADVGRAMHTLMERIRVMEADLASKRWNEKSIESMECRNEG